jgi:hypothetical protein
MRCLLPLLLGVSACFSDSEIVGQDSSAQTSAQTSATDSTEGAVTGEEAGTSTNTDGGTTGTANTTEGTDSASATHGTAVDSSTTDSTGSTDEDTDTEEPICDRLRRLEGDGAEFAVVTHPIVAGAAVKFTASNFSATDIGITIVDPLNTDEALSQQTVCAMGFPATYQATHCGVPIAGQYCAFLTSDANGSELYHAVLAIDVIVADDDPPDCPNELSSCAEIGPWSGDACVCFGH